MDGLHRICLAHFLNNLRSKRILVRGKILSLSLVSMLTISAQLWAQSTTVVGGPGALLMKHGDVISGELAPMGDQISVRIDENNSVFIPVRQIEHSARSIEEIYHYKLKKYGRIGTGEHYQMALWCLKNKLNDQAIAHYEELKRMVPNDPIVKRLAIQIKETVLQEPWAKEVIRQQAQQKAAQNNSGVITASGNNAAAGGVQTAGGSSTNATTSVNSKKNPANSSSTNSNSTTTASARPQSIPKQGTQPQTFTSGENTAKPMTFEPVVSDDAAKLFRSHLQPILIQKCGQSGCHGAQSTNDLKLLRPAANSTKKTAENNIASLVPFIDSADANKSTLYQLATRPHGTQKTGAIGQIDNDGSDELLGWLKLVIFQTQQGSLASNAAAMGLGPNGMPLQGTANGSSQLWQQHLDRLPGGGGAGGLTASGDRPSVNDAPVVSMQNYDSLIQKPFIPDIAREVTPSELDKLDEEIRRAEAAEKGEVIPNNSPASADPFDPNAFNNQFRKPE